MVSSMEGNWEQRNLTLYIYENKFKKMYSREKKLKAYFFRVKLSSLLFFFVFRFAYFFPINLTSIHHSVH